MDEFFRYGAINQEVLHIFLSQFDLTVDLGKLLTLVKADLRADDRQYFDRWEDLAASSPDTWAAMKHFSAGLARLV